MVLKKSFSLDMPKKRKITPVVIAPPGPDDRDDARDDLRGFGPGVNRKPPGPANQSNLFMGSLAGIFAPGYTFDETRLFVPDELMDTSKHKFIGVITDARTKALMSLVMELHEKAQQLPLPRNKAAQAGYNDRVSILKRQTELATLLGDEAVYAAFPELENGKTAYAVCQGWVVVVAKPTPTPVQEESSVLGRHVKLVVVTRVRRTDPDRGA